MKPVKDVRRDAPSWCSFLILLFFLIFLPKPFSSLMCAHLLAYTLTYIHNTLSYIHTYTLITLYLIYFLIIPTEYNTVFLYFWPYCFLSLWLFFRLYTRLNTAELLVIAFHFPPGYCMSTVKAGPRRLLS